MKDWKTTAIGCASGIVIGLGPFAIPGAEFTWKNIALAVLIAGFGYFTKDKE